MRRAHSVQPTPKVSRPGEREHIRTQSVTWQGVWPLFECRRWVQGVEMTRPSSPAVFHEDAAELEMGMLSSGSGGDERSNGVAALPGKVSVLAWCQLEAGRGAARGMKMS